MAVSYNGGYYYSQPQHYTATTATTYSTGGNDVWYWREADGTLKQSESPSHTHEMPGHTHGSLDAGSWRIADTTPENMVFHGTDGEPVMKINKGIEMKVGGKWVKVEEYLERLDMLDSMMEKMYELLSPWQREKLMHSQLQHKEDDFEHFDPDLFKV